VLFGNGLVRSMQFTCQATLAFADVPQADVTSASTFMSMVTQLSSALGVAVGAIALRFAAYVNSNSYGVPTMGDFRIAFALLGVIALVGVADACQLPSNAGTVVSGNGG
jgi:hypothetical protein